MKGKMIVVVVLLMRLYVHGQSNNPMPAIPAPKPFNSVSMGDWQSFPEMKLDIPIAPGPFEPTWESIEKNYPGSPAWLRDAKFGIWVHFGPQSAGESGDWYARNLYKPGKKAYANHLKKYGHPSTVGYKEVLRDWNPVKLDPAQLTKIYRDAGAKFLMIQGVHHDNFDLWNSKYQPWNSVNIGPKRDLIAEWAKACRADGMRFGVTFIMNIAGGGGKPLLAVIQPAIKKVFPTTVT